MTMMTGPYCAVMCNLINTNTHTHTHTQIHISRRESVGSVAASPDNLERIKEAGREAQGTQDLSKNCTGRESVSHLSHVTRRFVTSIFDPSSEETMRAAESDCGVTGPDCTIICNQINTHTIVAETRTGMEANEGAQYGNENGSGDEAETGTGTRVETRGRTQDGNGDGSGNENESISEDRNGDEDGDGGGNEDEIGEGGREANKLKEPHKSCRRPVGSGGDLDGKRENVDTKGLVQ